MDFDLRRDRPYGGYDQFEFEVPLGHKGDSYDRAVVRVEEIRQSLRIIRQCLDNMPEGPYKSDHRLTTPPPKERTLQDIETLIHHFLNVSWGPVIPAGEASFPIEATKGINNYHLVSDGGTTLLPHPHSHALFPGAAADTTDQPRTDDSRPDRDHRQYRLRHGGRGPMSMSDDPALIRWRKL